MNIPKKIHYFWTGKNISSKDLKNMMAIKAENPGFQINIWGNRKDESLIKNTFNSLTFGFGDNSYHLGLTQSKFSYVYRDIETAFSFLSQKINLASQTQLSDHVRKLSCIRGQSNTQSKERIFGDNHELIRYLRHIYYLNLQGNYKNYASSSDIARLIILFMEGGIYLDADVELSSSQIKESFNGGKDRFKAIKLRSDLGFGDCSGCGWESDSPTGEFCNSIIVSQRKSNTILNMLLHMAMKLKEHHFSLQIRESPYAENINKSARDLNISKFNVAMNYKNTNRLNLDTKCSLLDPTWRTGFNHDSGHNSVIDRKMERVFFTTEHTGPIFYLEHLGIGYDAIPPKKYRIKIKGNDTRMFGDVDASGNWAEIHDKKFRK